MTKLKGLRNAIVSFVVLILIWQLIYSVSRFSPALFPSPKRVALALVETFADGSTPRGVVASLSRFAVGYVSSAILAVTTGLFLGLLPRAFQFVNPIVQVLRPISPMAWAPFIVLWFGIGDVPAIFVVFIATFFPVLLSTVSAVVKIDPVYFKVARNFGVRQPQIMWKIILPAAFPQIASGIHLALGTAWVFLAAGEMNGVQSGLGYMIVDARNNFRTDTLLATIIVIGVIGLTLDGVLGTLEKALMKSWGDVKE